MDTAKPVPTPMIGRTLDRETDPFRPKETNEEPLSAETPYLSAIGALLYLASSTRPDISFVVSLLAQIIRSTDETSLERSEASTSISARN